MFSKTPLKRVLFPHCLTWGCLGVFLVSELTAGIFIANRPATAATNSVINFQARLMNATGSIVPDGNYNVEFKLYSGSSGGAALWTEDYTSTSGTGSSDVRVRVANGYLSVALGSQTPFPGTINWDQQLYLTMNIGGTGTGSFPGVGDGEMSPRIALTGVPYAFRAGQALQMASGNSTLSFTNPSNSNSITLPDASGVICLQGSSSCNFAAASGSSNYIQNTTTVQTGANLFIQTGNIANANATLKVLTGQTANVLEIQDSAGGVIAGIGSNGTIFSAPSGTTVPATARLFIQPLSAGSTAIIARAAASATADILDLQDSAGTSTMLSVGATGATNLRNTTNSATAFRVQNALGTTSVFDVDTSNGRIGVGTATPSYPVDVVGQINSSTALSLAGTVVCDTTGTTGCTAKSGSGFYIHNQTTIQSAASFYIQGSSGNVTGVLQANGADILDLKNSGGTNVATFGATGAVALQTTTDTTTAFQVLNSGNGKVFAVDTANNLVRVVTGSMTNISLTSGTGALQVGGDATDNLAIDDNEIMARSNGGTNTLYLQKLGGGLQIQASATVIKPGSDGTTAFQIQKSADSSVIFNADTTNKRIGIGTAAPTRTLDISGEINVAGLQPASSAGSGTAAVSSAITGGKGGNTTGTTGQTAGAGGAINIVGGDGGNASTGSTNGGGGAVTIRGGAAGSGTGTNNFRGNVILQDAGGYVGVGTAAPTAILHISGSDGLGSDLLKVTDSTATAMDVFRVMDEGAVLARTRTNSLTGFQVQNAAGSSMFDVDTSNSRVGIGTATPGYPLDVVGQVNSSTGFSIAGASICVSTGCTAASGSGFYIRNQATIQSAASLFIQGSSGNVTATLEANGADILDLKNSSGTNVTTFGNTGNVLVKPSTNSSTAFQIQPAASATPVLIADTSLGRVGINTSSPGYALDVNGDINSNTAVRVGGVTVCTSSCIPSSGSSNYIQNATTVQASANMNIRSSATNAVTGVLQGANGQTADIFQIQKWNGTSTTNLATIGSGGTATFQTTTNSTSGFAIQNSSSTPILNVDTVNGAVAIQSTNNSTVALKVTDSSGRSDFSVDTTSHALLVGNGSTGYSAPSLLILNSNTGTSSDPSGVDGSMYYNGTLDRFRCYQNGWRDCLQTNLIDRYIPSTTQVIATSTDTKLNFGTTVTSDGGLSVVGNNTFFFNKPGIWAISASTRMTATANAGERYIAIANGSNTNYRYSHQSEFPGSGIAALSTSTTYRFAQGDTVSIIMFQSSGVSLTNLVDFNETTNATFVWLGP